MNDIWVESTSSSSTGRRFQDNFAYRIHQFDHTTVALAAVTLVIVTYEALYHADVVPLLSPTELLWNCLVFVVPLRLVWALDRHYGGARDRSGSEETGNASTFQTFAYKSEAMRRILNVENGVSLSRIAAPDTFRSLGILRSGEPKQMPPGLGNWDNSCYQNSVIQGLASLPSVSQHLDLVCSNASAGSNTSLLTTSALRNITEKLNEIHLGNQKLWIPAKLKSMSSWQQQDAQEYFAKVIDEIEKEATAIVRTSRKKEIRKKVSRQLQNLECHKSALESPSTRRKQNGTLFDTTKRAMTEAAFRDSQLANNPLEGLLTQRVACTECGQSDGLSLIPFNCLTLPLKREMYNDIRESLEAYTNLEQISGVQCAQCTLLQSRRKLTVLLAVQRSRQTIVSDRVKETIVERLNAVNTALEDEDFSDATLVKKCKIPNASRLTATKSKQAVIAKPPRSLVLHLNRSVFDTTTGTLSKNTTFVRFPKRLDLGPYCLGTHGSQDSDAVERWSMNPRKSLLRDDSDAPTGPIYELQAVITHFGRHENGHYVCYRKVSPPATSSPDSEKVQPQWWRFSDDDVELSSEEQTLNQGGAFMLFYEQIDPDLECPEEDKAVESVHEVAESGNQTGATSEIALVDDAPILNGKNSKAEDHQMIDEAEVDSIMAMHMPELEGRAPHDDFEQRSRPDTPKVVTYG